MHVLNKWKLKKLHWFTKYCDIGWFIMLMCLFLLFIFFPKCDLCWPLWACLPQQGHRIHLLGWASKAESVNSSDKMIVKMMVSRENLQFNLDSKLWMGQRFIFGRPGTEESACIYEWELSSELYAWELSFTLRSSSSLYMHTVLDMCIMSGRWCILIYNITGVCCIRIFRRIKP
jgi:hypothetical protein